MLGRQRVKGFPLQGDLSYYIQRGATIQTYRFLGTAGAQALGTSALPIDTIIAAPWPVGLACRMDRIGFNVTALAAGSSARVGLYRALSAKNLYPGRLIVDSGAILTTSNGWKEANVDVRLSPGLYWRVYNAGVLAPTVSTPSVAAGAPHDHIMGYTAANPPVANLSLRVASAFGAFPATFPGGAAYGAVSAYVAGRFSA